MNNWRNGNFNNMNQRQSCQNMYRPDNRPQMRPDCGSQRPCQPQMKPDCGCQRPERPQVKPDCGCQRPCEPVKPDCGCHRPEKPQMKPDCGCQRPCEPVKPDCGCHRPEKPQMKPDCGCQRPCEPVKPDCGCQRPERPQEKPDCGCHRPEKPQVKPECRPEPPCPKKSREELMCYINEVSFAVNDMVLYLDTHPCDEKALAFCKEHVKKRDKALREYAALYGPLTIDTTDDVKSKTWEWVMQPWPWERGKC